MTRSSRNASTTPRIGSVQLGSTPRVVLAVAQDTPLLAGATEAGVDILEVRVDQLNRPTASRAATEVRCIARRGLPIIGTVRSSREGGSGNLSNKQRGAIYDAVLPLVDAIDIELRSADDLRSQIATARRTEKTVILSFHDFSATPSVTDLEDIAERAVGEGAQIVKIATQARTADDVLRLFAFTANHRASNLVTIAMGAIGAISRLAFPIAGSLMTYTSLSPAYGQLPLDLIVDHLRVYYPTYNEELIERSQLLQYA